MKIQISRKLLVDVMNRMQGAISERSLAHLGLRATEQSLQIAAADRVLSIYSQIPCEIITPGTAFISAKFFSDVIKELPDGPVNFQIQGPTFIISSHQSSDFNIKMPLIENTHWVEKPNIEIETPIKISSGNFQYLVDSVHYSVSQDSPRNYGTVAYLHQPQPEHLRMVGTDGFRLAICDIDVKKEFPNLGDGICLSKRAVLELARLTVEGFEEIELAISKDRTVLIAQVPDYQIFARLSSVKYPDYSAVLKKQSDNQLKLKKAVLQAVSRRVLLAADKKSRALQLSFSESSLTLSSKTMGSSEGKETISLEGYRGPTRKLTVNGKYLSDTLSVINSESLILVLRDENDPIILIPDGEPEGCRSKHILVPIKESD
jgi:DNA polymerase III subunit beta